MNSEKIKIVIVEDEFVIAEDIRAQLQDHDYHVLSTFDKAEEACPFILKEQPDIILIDINLAGKMDGIDLVRNIQEKLLVPVVYITANSDNATYQRAKVTRPNAFLIKPFTHENLLASVELALFNFSEGKAEAQIGRSAFSNQDHSELLINSTLFLRNNGRYYKIDSNDILFIEASGSYLHLQTSGGRYTLSQNLTHFLKKNPLPNLIRIHRSFIVNINKVDSFEDAYVFVQKHQLPLSSNFKSNFQAHIHYL